MDFNFYTFVICIFWWFCSGVWASIFEHILHRHVMHAKPFGFKYAFKAHDLRHHVTFRGDTSYTTQDPETARQIPMAKWNVPVIITLCSIPALCIAFSFIDNWKLPVSISLGMAIWGYAKYEYLHWHMHKPGNNSFEKKPHFKKLNRHHYIHHEYKRVHNFNVTTFLGVFWGDLIFGTLKK